MLENNLVSEPKPTEKEIELTSLLEKSNAYRMQIFDRDLGQLCAVHKCKLVPDGDKINIQLLNL